MITCVCDWIQARDAALTLCTKHLWVTRMPRLVTTLKMLKAPPRASHRQSICSVGYYALTNIPSKNPSLRCFSSSSPLRDVVSAVYNPAPVLGQGSCCHVLGDNVHAASD